MGASFFGWSANPFTFSINPDCFSGYGSQLESITAAIFNGEKFSLLLGPTGSGKTTIFQRIRQQFSVNGWIVLYLPKPPKPDEWVAAFQPLFRRFSRQPTLYSLSEQINNWLGSRHCLLLVDECHEAPAESLEWMRTITDHTTQLQLVMGGLPAFESLLVDQLETLFQRVTTTIRLSNLSKSETRELIRKRIEQNGGEDIHPFSQEAIDNIYEKSAGFPREILRACNELTLLAETRKSPLIDASLLHQTRQTVTTFDELPEKQKLVLELLAANGVVSPSKIVPLLPEKEYKDKDNAVRSVNNLLARLLTQGFVRRSKSGKCYKYQVAPKYRPLFVKA